MSEAVNAPCLSIGPHQPSSDWPLPDENTSGRRVAVAGPRGDLPRAGPAQLRNRVAAGLCAIGHPSGTWSPERCCRVSTLDPSVASLAVRGPNSPTEETWSAQRITTPAWKAWKEV